MPSYTILSSKICRTKKLRYMAKLFVFGIGGTGSRVLKALTMLLASGVRCDTDVVIPIVIDPDSGGGNVDDTATLMQKYEEVRNKLGFANNVRSRFFRTEIRNIVGQTNYQLQLNNVKDGRFSKYISLDAMSEANQALAHALFSEKNLESDMCVGFRGNPNIGSVVLNQFEGSEDFGAFANNFTPGDKIFIISSIYGGTGASGFPLLVKMLRTSQTIANHALVNDAPIGAITVLPYFKVESDPAKPIDSSTFSSKTRSALAYYNRTFDRQAGNNRPNVLYYIGDDQRATVYQNVDGGAEQYNNAHFIELASALAVIDFANMQDIQPGNCRYKEFGIEEDVNEIIIKNIDASVQSLIVKPLTQFTLFAKYLRDSGSFMDHPWAKDRGINSTFVQSPFFQNLTSGITGKYLGWLEEMSQQDRKFYPYEIDGNAERVFNLVKGLDPKRVSSLDKNYALFNNRLDSFNSKVTEGSVEQQFMELFYLATEKLCKEKLNIE